MRWPDALNSKGIRAVNLSAFCAWTNMALAISPRVATGIRLIFIFDLLHLGKRDIGVKTLMSLEVNSRGWPRAGRPEKTRSPLPFLSRFARSAEGRTHSAHE